MPTPDNPYAELKDFLGQPLTEGDEVILAVPVTSHGAAIRRKRITKITLERIGGEVEYLVWCHNTRQPRAPGHVVRIPKEAAA